MSADGEIQIAVRSEGVEDAAGEFGGDTAGGGGPGGTGGGGATAEGIQSTASSTKRMAGLLGAIAALLTVIEPIMRVLGVVSNVLQAFVAPLAMVLMRLLQPALRWLLQLLPGWLNWIEENEGKIDAVIAQIYMLGALLVPVLELIRDSIIGTKNWLERNWPGGSAFDDVTGGGDGPFFGAAREGSFVDLGPRGFFEEQILERLRNLGNDSEQQRTGPGPRNAPTIVFSGGLSAFLDTKETDPNLEQ